MEARGKQSVPSSVTYYIKKRRFLSDNCRIAQRGRAKWLKGEAAINHRKVKDNGQHPQSKTSTLLLKATGTSSSPSQHLDTPATSLVQPPNLGLNTLRDLGTIEISSESNSDEEVPSKLASQHPHASHFHQPSSPTLVGSSPIRKGKKRAQDVLEISSGSEGNDGPAKKKRGSSILLLSD